MVKKILYQYESRRTFGADNKIEIEAIKTFMRIPDIIIAGVISAVL